jgi:hypothetical protein
MDTENCWIFTDTAKPRFTTTSREEGKGSFLMLRVDGFGELRDS